MNDDKLEYQSDMQIQAKIEYSPAEAVPAGWLVIRDTDNRLRTKIELTPENIDTWFDLTAHVQKVGGGYVEAQLMRTVGNGPWRAKLYLRTYPAADVAEYLERAQSNHLTPSVTFRRKS